MFDLIFFILMVVTLVKASKGNYNETLANFAFVFGIIAGLVGCVSAFFDFSVSSIAFGLLNVLVLAIALFVKKAAKHLAQVYLDKQNELKRQIELENENALANFSRFSCNSSDKSDKPRP